MALSGERGSVARDGLGKRTLSMSLGNARRGKVVIVGRNRKSRLIYAFDERRESGGLRRGRRSRGNPAVDENE